MSQANVSAILEAENPAWTAGFGRLVRDALAHLHDPTYLQTHPLTRILDLPASARSPGLGRNLRQRLVEAIDALRPGPDAAPGSPAWRRHQILTLRYVEALEVAAIAERLAVSRSQYFSDLRAATEAVISLLREPRGLATEGLAQTRRRGSEETPPVLVHRADPTGRSAARLPLPLSSFVGRARELTEIKGALRATRLLTLTGPGGCGKTRLALQVAADLQDEDAADVRFVELAALADSAPVPYAVAGALGVREQPRRSILTTLLDVLRDRPVLLVLDNCEHLLDACARLAEAVLRECPRVRILATSREALAIPGEIAWPVPLLAIPPRDARLALAELQQYDAARLFLDRAAEAQPALVPTDADVPAIGQICARLDGLPFALELAAAQTRVLSLAQLAARLDDRFGLLTRGGRTALPRQQTLCATIDWSCSLLTEPERVLFRRLAVFAGGWTLEAAETVCGDDLPLAPSVTVPLPQGDVLRLLARLVDQSLVVVELPVGGSERGRNGAPGAEARYRFLESIREYARERLGAADEEELARARHGRWCLALAERADAELAGPEQLAWLRRLELEHDNVRAALAWCRRTETAGGAEIGPRLANAVASFWSTRGHYAEGRAILRDLLALTARPDGNQTPEERASRRGARSRALIAAGQLASLQADYDAARQLLEEGLALAQELADDRAIVAARCDLAVVSQMRGDLVASWAQFDEGLAHARRAGDSLLVQRVLLLTAECADFIGDHGRARALDEEALALARARGNVRGVAAALSLLGWVVFRDGDPGRARALVEEALEGLKELGHRDGLEWTLLRLAVIARDQDDAEAERASLEQSLALARELGDSEVIGWSLYGLAWVAHDADDLAQARALFAESLTRFRALNHVGGVARTLEGLSRVTRDQGDDAAARGYLEESLAIRRAMPNRGHLAGTLWGLGLAAYGQGDLGAARAWLDESLALWRELGDRRSIAGGLEELGVVAAARGRARMALRLAGAAAALREEIGAPLSPIRQGRLLRRLEPARRTLGDAAAKGAARAGRTMTIEAVIAEALQREGDL